MPRSKSINVSKQLNNAITQFEEAADLIETAASTLFDIGEELTAFDSDRAALDVRQLLHVLYTRRDG